MIFSHIPITVNRSEVARYLGFKKQRTETTDGIDSLIEQLITKAKYLLAPAGIIRNVTITGRRPEMYEVECDHGGYTIRGEKIYKHLDSCERITLLVVTVGEDLDKEIEHLFKEQEPTKALILDAIGSDAVERVADHLNDYVIKEARRKGYATKFRYSPGYGGWSVENQRDIIQVIKAEQIGVTITEYSQLEPRKSVSAIIGWYPTQQGNDDSKCTEMQENKQENKCSRCELVDCSMRESQ